MNRLGRWGGILLLLGMGCKSVNQQPDIKGRNTELLELNKNQAIGKQLTQYDPSNPFQYDNSWELPEARRSVNRP